MGDPDRLQQVFSNLLSNAVKFTPRGGHVWLTLKQRRTESAVEVRDDGAGIDPDLLPHVFERFRQGDSSTKRAYGGLGLGLAIALHLVEAHGGTIHAASPGAGGGSLFTVRLPSPAAGAVVPKPPVARRPPAIAPEKRRGVATLEARRK